MKGIRENEVIYLWIEDKKDKAAYCFWKTFVDVLFPDVIVVSKENCSRLIRALEELNDNKNRYLIAYDHSFDNPQTIMEIKSLRRAIDSRDNVQELRFISFEYILLEFKQLIDWIYASEDEFREKRKNIIITREKLIKAVAENEDYKEILTLDEYPEHIEKYNIEQLASKILFDLTRNTGFEVSKGYIGECWISDCCGFNGRQEDDLCGLDERRPGLREKMLDIYRGTMIQTEFSNAGLEV